MLCTVGAVWAARLTSRLPTRLIEVRRVNEIVEDVGLLPSSHSHRECNGQNMGPNAKVPAVKR